MMKNRFVVVSVVLLFSLAFSGGMASKGNTSPDYEAVKKTIEQSIGWAVEKNFEAMFRLWADNMLPFLT